MLALLAASILVLSGSPPAAAAGTSYANPGGSGDRTGIITATEAGLLTAGTASRLINGNLTTQDTWLQSVGMNSARFFKWDFGTAKKIDEAKFYQELTTPHGVMQWAGSNDDSTYTDIGGTFTLGGATTQTITTLSGNTTSYRYYQLYGVSGSSDSTPYIYQFEFKIQ